MNKTLPRLQLKSCVQQTLYRSRNSLAKANRLEASLAPAGLRVSRVPAKFNLIQRTGRPLADCILGRSNRSNSRSIERYQLFAACSFATASMTFLAAALAHSC
jgi:hypothetical protein